MAIKKAKSNIKIQVTRGKPRKALKPAKPLRTAKAAKTLKQAKQQAGKGVKSTPIKSKNPIIQIEGLHLYYDSEPEAALNNISIDIEPRKVTAFIGPSGCGKSSLLRCLNRMNDLVADCRIEGRISLDGKDIYDPNINISELRRQVGMVFQKPNPFPKSVYENVAYGLRIQGEKDKKVLDQVVEESLKSAALWDEVKERLDSNALNLSGGQQQRLVIARAIAVQPDVILLDEPASALDPISTLKIEELIYELKKNYTIIIVTHNMQQAARVSDYAAFLYLGKLIEYDKTRKIFTKPQQKMTEDYITGRYG